MNDTSQYNGGSALSNLVRLSDSEPRALACLAIIFVAAVLVTIPIYFNGIPQGNDLPQHFQFAISFRESIHDQILSPGWAGDSNLGYGDPGVRFYPPLGYYLLVAAEALTGNWCDASVLSIGFLFFLGGVGIFLWSREWFDNASSLVGAILYTVAPYHVNQIYNAFTFAEFAAASVLPFCFWAVTRVAWHRRVSDISILSVCYALLLLTHLPLSVLGSICLAVYAATLLVRREAVRQLSALSLGVIAGLAASSFYWYRMVSDLSYVNHSSPQFTSGAYDFSKNFLLSYFYLSWEEYDGRSLWFADLTLVITAAFFIPGVYLYYRAKRASGHNAAHIPRVLMVFVFAVILASPISLPVWDNVRILQQTQFPWRLMTILSIIASILAAAGWRPVLKALRSDRRPWAILAIGLFVLTGTFTATQVIRQASYSDREKFQDLTESLRTAKSYECWWPVWAGLNALNDRRAAFADDRKVTVESWGKVDRNLIVHAGVATNLRLATFYYPNWKATVNGNEVVVSHDQDGAIIIPIPDGEAHVSVVFRESAGAEFAMFLSGTAWLMLLGYLAFAAIRARSISNDNLR